MDLVLAHSCISISTLLGKALARANLFSQPLWVHVHLRDCSQKAVWVGPLDLRKKEFSCMDELCRAVLFDLRAKEQDWPILLINIHIS